MLTISRIAFAAADASTGPASAPAEKPAIAVKPRKAAKPSKPATKAAKPGKPAKRAASTTSEPETDKRAERAERIAADRATVAAFYATFGSSLSVPVKPVRGFKLLATTAHPNERHPSPRQAAAICVAFAAAGTKLSDGAKAPRTFEHSGVPSAIENGVLRDAVSSGMLRVGGSSPEAETLTLTKSGLAYIVSSLGEKRLKLAKLL